MRQQSGEHVVELELVARMAAADATALDEFHRLYRARILGTARRIVSDDSAAEDVLQDVLWSVYRGAARFRGSSTFSSWVYRITQNAARMYLRRNRRAPMPMDLGAEAEDGALPVAATPHESPFELVVARRAMEQLEQAVGRLDPVSRELYEALDVHGEDRDTVAQRMGITMSALKSRLHRTRQSLRLAFEA